MSARCAVSEDTERHDLLQIAKIYPHIEEKSWPWRFDSLKAVHRVNH